MATYDYSFLENSWVDTNIIPMFRDINRIQERINLWKIMYPDVFPLLEKKTIEDAVFCSNEIEHICVPRDRVGDIIAGDEPNGLSEIKIAGYYDALNCIWDSNTPLSADLIKDVHTKLMGRYCPDAGKLRGDDSPHVGYGTMSAVRKPVCSSEIQPSLDSFCDAVNEILSNDGVDVLIALPCIIMDFIGLSPFRNGNGRMYRILIEYVLLNHGYSLARYSSVDAAILSDVKQHTHSIYQSSHRWEGDEVSYAPFMYNLIYSVWVAAKNLESRLPSIEGGRCKKHERVRISIASVKDGFTKSDIADMLPDISPITIQKEISAMVSEGLLIREGTTKSSRYYHCIVK